MNDVQGGRTVPVVFVIPPRVLLLDVAGPAEVLRRASIEQAAVRFAMEFVAPTSDSGSSIGLTLARLSRLPATLAPGTIVVVPGTADAIDGDDGDASKAAEAAIVSWLREAIRPGVRLATVCSGALLAGRAGLLDGLECTTHHDTAAELSRTAPRARVLANRLFVEAGERMTSAGVTAGIDLMLHIVAKEAGDATALAVARHMVVYLRRSGADPQLSPWLAGRNHVHPAIHRVQDAVSRDPAADWPAARLAEVAATSVRNLSRLFAEQTGMSAAAYVSSLRIATARELLASSKLSMERVAERAGFASTRQFRRVWNGIHATPPGKFREEIRSRG